MIKKHNLLICPVCQEQGRTSVLGEIDPLSDLLIKRDRNTIRISGAEFKVTCEVCGEEIYHKTVKQTLISRRALFEELFGYVLS